MPIVKKEIKGSSINQGLYYDKEVDSDEVEDLFLLLKAVKEQFPDVQAVASGAIFSNY